MYKKITGKIAKMNSTVQFFSLVELNKSDKIMPPLRIVFPQGLFFLIIHSSENVNVLL